MGAWNVLSLREDDHPPLLSSELKCLNIGIAALSEVRRQDSLWQDLHDLHGQYNSRVVSPTVCLVTLMVTMPKELL